MWLEADNSGDTELMELVNIKKEYVLFSGKKASDP